MKFAVIDRCPGPSAGAAMILEVKRRTGQSLQSWYRGKDARALLNANGKHDQDYLYNGWVRRLPGFNPANPPGYSPHECRSDGVSPPGYSRGSKIPEELCGQDWGPDASAVIAAYREMGVLAYHPYDSPQERQHVGIAKVPKKIPPLLKRGVKSKRVAKLKHELWLCRRPHSNGVRYFNSTNRLHTMGRALDWALREYQRDHGLTPDGVLGPMTQAQLDHSVAYWTKRAKDAARPKPKPHGDKPGPLFGTDLSSNNPAPIDAHRMKHDGDIDFAHLKVSEGGDYPSASSSYIPELKKRVHDFRVEGVLVGGYHFARPQPGRSGAQEADHFIHMLHTADLLRKGDLPPVLDLEAVVGLGQAELRKWVKDFAKRVKKVTGITIWIYTGRWFWDPRMGAPARFTGFSRYPLWLAAYVHDFRPFVPRAWKRPVLWQFTSTASIPGANGHCDKSRFDGSLADLKSLTIR